MLPDAFYHSRWFEDLSKAGRSSMQVAQNRRAVAKIYVHSILQLAVDDADFYIVRIYYTRELNQ